MLLEDLPYDYDLVTFLQRCHDLRAGGRFQSTLASPSRYLDTLTPYVPGDPLKSLDWRVLARKDEWVIRRHLPFTQPRYGIIVDGSSCMHWPTATIKKAHQLKDPTKWMVAMKIACHLGYHLNGGGREVDLVLWIPPDPSSSQSFEELTQTPFCVSHPFKKNDDVMRCYEYLDTHSSATKLGNLWSQENSTLTEMTSNPWLYLATSPTRKRWLFITDGLHPYSQKFLEKRPHLRLIHLLSRLERDYSWLKKPQHYRSSPLSNLFYRGSKLRRECYKAREKLMDSPGLNRKHRVFLHTHSPVDFYLENLNEVL